MRSPGINGEGELRGQPANPGSPGKMAVKTECVCVYNWLTTMPPYSDTVGWETEGHPAWKKVSHQQCPKVFFFFGKPVEDLV